jgi:hypothetical protein
MRLSAIRAPKTTMIAGRLVVRTDPTAEVVVPTPSAIA